MKFITVRDLRSKPAQLRQELLKEKDVVLTSNGKPFAIVSSTSEDNLENSLSVLRRVRAERAVTAMQTQSLRTGNSRLSAAEVNLEIAAVRKKHLHK